MCSQITEIDEHVVIVKKWNWTDLYLLCWSLMSLSLSRSRSRSLLTGGGGEALWSDSDSDGAEETITTLKTPSLPSCVFTSACFVFQSQCDFLQLQKHQSFANTVSVTPLQATQSVFDWLNKNLCISGMREWLSAGLTSAGGVGSRSRPSQGGAHRWCIPRLGRRRFGSCSGRHRHFQCFVSHRNNKRPF